MTTKPFEITGLRVHNAHCRNFRFTNPAAPTEWDAFCAENDVSCSHDDFRTFVKSHFDCFSCREKLENVLHSFSDPIPPVETTHDSLGEPPNGGGVVNLQVTFERQVDATWMPLAIDYASSVRLGFAECERVVQQGLAVDTAAADALEQQNHWLLVLVTTLVRTIHAVHRMQAVAIFDTNATCPVMTHITKQTDLLMSLLHTQLGRAREAIVKILGLPAGTAGLVKCPALTDIHTPYFARWKKDNETLCDHVLSVLLDNNRKRLLHFRGWVTTTSAILSMPQFTSLATQAQSKWRYVDSDDFNIAHNEISERSVYVTAFELVLGCLAKEPPPGCPLDVPTVQMDATMLDSRANAAYNTCVAGYKKIMHANQVQLVPSCFPLTTTMKNEIESTVRRLCSRFQAYEHDFHGIVAAMPKLNDNLYARAKLRFLHAHSIVNQGIILRRLACFARYLHDVSPILRGAECGEISKCMHMVIASVQYNRLAARFSDFVVARLESELTTDTPVALKSSKKKKSTKKKMRAVTPPPEPRRTETKNEVKKLDLLQTMTTEEDDTQGTWEEEIRKRRTAPQQSLPLPPRKQTNPRDSYVPPSIPDPPALSALIPNPSPTPTTTPSAPVPPTTPTATPSDPVPPPTTTPSAPVPPTTPTATPSDPVPPTTPTATPSDPVPPPTPTVAASAPVPLTATPSDPVPPLTTTPSDPVPPTVAAENRTVPSANGRKKKHRNARMCGVMPVASISIPPANMMYLPQYVGIPGYDPSMYYMCPEATNVSFNPMPTRTPIPVAMCSPAGTVLYGHFLPQQLVYMPMSHL